MAPPPHRPVGKSVLGTASKIFGAHLYTRLTRAYSKAVQIGEAREIVDEMINIKDYYEAILGAVTDAAPKVFLKYFFVNTKTGEKSGEMMAALKLG